MAPAPVRSHDPSISSPTWTPCPSLQVTRGHSARRGPPHSSPAARPGLAMLRQGHPLSFLHARPRTSRSTKAQAHGRRDETGGRARPSPTSRHCPRFHKCRPGAAPLSPTGPRGLQGLRGELCRRQGPRRTVPAEKHAPATDLATRGRLAHTCRQHRAAQPTNSGMKGLVHIRMP